MLMTPSSFLTEKWLWIIIGSLVLILVTPLIVLWVILTLPPVLKVTATIILLICWGIVAGYKDWIVSSRGEKKQA